MAHSTLAHTKKNTDEWDVSSDEEDRSDLDYYSGDDAWSDSESSAEPSHRTNTIPRFSNLGTRNLESVKRRTFGSMISVVPDLPRGSSWGGKRNRCKKPPNISAEKSPINVQLKTTTPAKLSAPTARPKPSIWPTLSNKNHSLTTNSSRPAKPAQAREPPGGSAKTGKNSLPPSVRASSAPCFNNLDALLCKREKTGTTQRKKRMTKQERKKMQQERAEKARQKQEEQVSNPGETKEPVPTPPRTLTLENGSIIQPMRRKGDTDDDNYSSKGKKKKKRVRVKRQEPTRIAIQSVQQNKIAHIERTGKIVGEVKSVKIRRNQARTESLELLKNFKSENDDEREKSTAMLKCCKPCKAAWGPNKGWKPVRGKSCRCRGMYAHSSTELAVGRRNCPCIFSGRGKDGVVRRCRKGQSCNFIHYVLDTKSGKCEWRPRQKRTLRMLPEN